MPKEPSAAGRQPAAAFLLNMAPRRKSPRPPRSQIDADKNENCFRNSAWQIVPQLRLPPLAPTLLSSHDWEGCLRADHQRKLLVVVEDLIRSGQRCGVTATGTAGCIDIPEPTRGGARWRHYRSLKARFFIPIIRQLGTRADVISLKNPGIGPV